MEKVEVKIQRRHELAQIPKQGSELAGGWDVVATEIIKESDEFVICKLGFSLQPPANYKVTLVPRSSLTSTKWIVQNSPGLGDPDYLGEYQYRFRCLPTGITTNAFGVSKLTYDEFPFEAGDRIGQIYLEEIIPIKWTEVKYFEETKRGEGGFGHTGK